MGELWGQLWVAKLYHRGVACVLERIKLSAPRATQTARIVQLQLGGLREFVTEEQRGKQLEIVLLEWNLRLIIVYTFSVDFPVFAA